MRSNIVTPRSLSCLKNVIFVFLDNLSIIFYKVLLIWNNFHTLFLSFFLVLPVILDQDSLYVFVCDRINFQIRFLYCRCYFFVSMCWSKQTIVHNPLLKLECMKKSYWLFSLCFSLLAYLLSGCSLSSLLLWIWSQLHFSFDTIFLILLYKTIMKLKPILLLMLLVFSFSCWVNFYFFTCWFRISVSNIWRDILFRK